MAHGDKLVASHDLWYTDDGGRMKSDSLIDKPDSTSMLDQVATLRVHLARGPSTPLRCFA